MEYCTCGKPVTLCMCDLEDLRAESGQLDTVVELQLTYWKEKCELTEKLLNSTQRSDHITADYIDALENYDHFRKTTKLPK